MIGFEFEFERGAVHLPVLGLWLDPHTSRTGPERVFVSHAHSDHIGRHREVVLTAPTARFLGERLGARPVEHVLDYGVPAKFQGPGMEWEIRLCPAGHILGSAMAWIGCAAGSLLYTGDFKLREGLSVEACCPERADVLVMETTFGRPEYVFPPVAEVVASLIGFCRETLAEGATPVLLGYSLGKSQEILRRLGEAGLPVTVHPQIRRMTLLYEMFGQVFPPMETLGRSPVAGRVVICPPQGPTLDALRCEGPVRTAVITGWAMDPGCRFRYGVDAAFPLSDHADYPDLLELVRRVQPRQIWTLHGFAADFARTLRELGWDARALGKEEQLDLALNLGPRPPRRPSRRSQPGRTGRDAQSGGTGGVSE